MMRLSRIGRLTFGDFIGCGLEFRRGRFGKPDRLDEPILQSTKRDDVEHGRQYLAFRESKGVGIFRPANEIATLERREDGPKEARLRRLLQQPRKITPQLGVEIVQTEYYGTDPALLIVLMVDTPEREDEE